MEVTDVHQSDRDPSANRAQSRLALATFDQALSSASNFVLIFLLARGSAASDLGRLLIGYTLVTLAIAVCRGAFGAILGMDLPSASVADASVLARQSVAGVIVVSGTAVAALVAFTLLSAGSEGAVNALLVIALATPIVLLQDLQRYWAVAVAKPAHALIADAVWLLTCGAGFAVSMLTALTISAAVGAALWAVGAVLACAVLALFGYRAAPNWCAILPWLISDARRVRLGADALLGSLAPLANGGAVAAIAGFPVTAAVRGAGILFGPLNVLSGAIPLALVPEALRSSKRRAHRLFAGTAAGFSLLALIWAVLLAVTPDEAGTQLMGATWPSVQEIILITGVEYVGIGLWSAAAARLRAAGRVRLALRLRIAFSVSSIVLPVVAVAVWNTAAAFAGALALNATVLGVMAYAVSRHPVSRGSGSSI